VTGLLVPPGDPPAFAGALQTLLGNPAWARRMGEAARAQALERFDIGRHVEATAAVYRGALGGRA
jgi:glycosyltransferase involved in cell wall biosynthesis